MVRILVLALTLVAVAGLAAIATRDTNAYFGDQHSGMFGGTLGSWSGACPYRVDPGTSKAQYWNLDSCQAVRILPIAQRDSSGALFLDFGDMVVRDRSSSPDVFRIVSLIDESLTVTFGVTGQMTAFVTLVRLDNSAAGVLKGRATESVSINIRVPDHARPGRYSGTLTVHVDGWTDDAQLRMTIDVRSKKPVRDSVPDRHRSAPRKSTQRPAQVPCPTATPAAASTPASTLIPVPPTKPTAAWAPAPTPSGGTNGE
jgi:hypothetical protein